MEKFYQIPEVSEVSLKDAFWTPYTESFRNITVPYAFGKFYETKSVQNFINAAKGIKEHVGNPFDDGLILETVTGASNFLNQKYDESLDKLLDELIETITAAQLEDGYLCTKTVINYPEKRWGENGGDIVWQHDLYNNGTLIEAGVAHYKATGKTTLLLPAIKAAALICSYIGEEPKHFVIPGHSLPELAFMDLYRLIKTDNKVKAYTLEYKLCPEDILELLRFWYDNRGNQTRRTFKEMSRFEPERWQNTMPFSDMRYAMGHAVRAGLCYAGAASFYRETERSEYKESLMAIWQDVFDKKIHISGGIGSRADIEGFDMEYSLQNDAYLETCAGIALAFWAAEMSLIDTDSSYFDVFELSLYNNILGSMSKDFKKFYYDNPLVNDGTKNRWEWHGCPCCPPMLAKMYSSLARYIYNYNDAEIKVNLYIDSELKTENLQIAQNEKEIRITAKNDAALKLRIPAYAQNFAIKVNGNNTDYQTENGYAVISIGEGETAVNVCFDEKLCEICANSKVEADIGRVCIMKGALLYCAEGADNKGDVDFVIAENTTPVIKGENIEIQTTDGKKATLIPYYKRNNRVSENTSDSKMAVWFKKENMPNVINTKDKLYGYYKIY